MKKSIIKILIFVLCLTSIGCSSHIPEKQNNSQTESTIKTSKEIPEFEFPDMCFNRFFSKDEKNNIYFKAGKKLYKMDSQQKLLAISDLLIDNKYLITHTVYNNNSIYLLVLCVNQNKKEGTGIAKMDVDGHNFQYLFDIKESITSDIFIYNHNIYINPNSYEDYLASYSLREPYDEIFLDSRNIFWEREKAIKTALPHFTYENRIFHIYNGKIYMLKSNENGTKSIIIYNPKDDKSNEINLDFTTEEFITLDLIDTNWFIYTKEAIYQYNIDFTDCKKIMDIHSSYTIVPQGNEKYKIY